MRALLPIAAVALFVAVLFIPYRAPDEYFDRDARRVVDDVIDLVEDAADLA